MPQGADEVGTQGHWGMFPGMSEKSSKHVENPEAPPARYQLAVRLPRSAIRTFKLACVRAGITMQDGVEEALLRWVEEKEGQVEDE